MIDDLDVRCPIPDRGAAPILPVPVEGVQAPRPRIGIFSLTSCEGCSLTILEQEDELLSLLGAIDIVDFREAKSGADGEVDIAFVDGAVSSPHDVARVRQIRKNARILVAIGACACLGGVNTLKHAQSEHDYRQFVYGDRAPQFPTGDARPLSAVVRVDYELPGCPMVGAEFLRFVRCVLSGRPFRLPNDAVCVECKRRGTLCLYEKGETCLGPVTRGGCAAICPAYGARCEGCRGLLGNEQLRIFARNCLQLHGTPLAEILDRLRLFGVFQGETLPDSQPPDGPPT
ncbi:MAG: hypothetical protein JNG88_10475 [Phycisphaerales bacterium]|nr:hypothetical protein [Phycisphaerales bacterium]